MWRMPFPQQWGAGLTAIAAGPASAGRGPVHSPQTLRQENTRAAKASPAATGPAAKGLADLSLRQALLQQLVQRAICRPVTHEASAIFGEGGRK